MELVSLLVLVSSLLWVALAIYRALSSPRRDIPGPWMARITRFWYFNRVKNGSFHLENIALHEKYGPIVRVAPNWYSISSPDTAVYHISSKFPKSDWYEGWKHPSPDRWSLFTDQNIKRHAETRKRFQGLYSMSSLLSYEQYVDECIDILLSRLTQIAQSGESVDMAHWLQCFAFDVMGNITYSERFGFLDNGEDINGTLAALQTSLVYSTLAGIYAWFHPYAYAVMEHIPGSGAAGRNFLMAFVNRKIEARNQERKTLIGQKFPEAYDPERQPRDFLDKLSDSHEQHPEKVTRDHIFMMGLSNVIAGSDTTAISLSAILHFLMRSPKILAKLREEIDAQTTMNGHIPFKVACRMPYLQATIKEALRLHPATGLPLWRIAPEGGAVVANKHFPAGAVIGVNSWVAHYDQEVFGTDASAFRPERWLEAMSRDKEHYQRMEANYIPFGLGSRTCIGRHISMLEMTKLIPELISRFDIMEDKPESRWKCKNYWFVKPEHLQVRLTTRSSPEGTR
ncbi:putative cytochrome P450 pisatin demethylase [Xylariaceae sp. FL1651]|nr:putative cytochrome P450 pisatin demethylase [Xylariaceae sp. FL1651]